MIEENTTYTAALAELEKILTSMRSGTADVDSLTAQTARAVELLKFCRARLTTTETELREILESLQSPQS